MTDPRELGAHCDACPLRAKVPVFATPPKKKLRLVIVGEGPGAKEEAQGAPFVGMSGSLLDQTLRKAQIDREEAYVTNAFLCRAETDKEADAAAACCAPRLLGELAGLGGPLVLVGKTAARSVLGVGSIILARGFVWKVGDASKKVAALEVLERRHIKKGRVVPEALKLKLATMRGRQALSGRVAFPTVHPSMVMRQDAWRSLLDIDFKRVKRYLDGTLTDESDLTRVNSVEEFINA